MSNLTDAVPLLENLGCHLSPRLKSLRHNLHLVFLAAPTFSTILGTQPQVIVETVHFKGWREAGFDARKGYSGISAEEIELS